MLAYVHAGDGACMFMQQYRHYSKVGHGSRSLVAGRCSSVRTHQEAHRQDPIALVQLEHCWAALLLCGLLLLLLLIGLLLMGLLLPIV